MVFPGRKSSILDAAEMNRKIVGRLWPKILNQRVLRCDHIANDA